MDQADQPSGAAPTVMEDSANTGVPPSMGALNPGPANTEAGAPMDTHEDDPCYKLSTLTKVTSDITRLAGRFELP